MGDTPHTPESLRDILGELSGSFGAAVSGWLDVRRLCTKPYSRKGRHIRPMRWFRYSAYGDHHYLRHRRPLHRLLGHLQRTTRRRTMVLLVAMCVGVMVTLVQHLGVTSMFAMEWPEPLASLLAITMPPNLDLEFLNMNQFAAVSPLPVFVAKISVFVVAYLLIIVIHCIFVRFKQSGKFRQLLVAMCVGVMATFVQHLGVTSLFA